MGKINILELRDRYKSYISDAELVRLIENDEIPAYLFFNGKERIVPNGTFMELGSPRNVEKLMKYFLSPTVERIKDEEPLFGVFEEWVHINSFIFKTDDIDTQVLPKVCEAFRYIQPLDSEFCSVRVKKTSSDEWITETYDPTYAKMLKLLFLMYLQNPSKSINVDELVKEVGLGQVADSKMDKFFKNKHIYAYITSVNRQTKINFNKTNSPITDT